MLFTYHQMTGILRNEAGATVGAGYSGRDEGRNNPAAEKFHGLGPIPAGDWVLGEAETHGTLGPVSMTLTPAAGTETYGRTGFYVHGDSAAHPGLSSDGCIVLSLLWRAMLSKTPGATIRVVNTPFPLPAAG